MKYHNLKRVFAGFMATALTFSTAAFVASAEETTDITYYLNGERSDNGSYVLTVSAQGGRINVGAIEIAYNTDAFEDVSVEYAENIKNADFYMGYDSEIADGKAEIAFMSAAGLSDSDAGLFATNPSGTVAYIDATGSEPVDIATLTFTFGDDYTYDSLFVTGEAVGSVNSAKVAAAKAIIHAVDGYDTTFVDVTSKINNKLVFTADDFTLSDLEAVYDGTPKTITIDSDAAQDWDLYLGTDIEYTTNADEYSITLKNVSGEGYYDADEIAFTQKFVIKKADEEITAPANPAAVDYVEGGYDLANLEIEGWDVVTTGKVNAGKYEVEVKYAGTLDTNNINYTFDGKAVTSADEITTTVELTVNKIKGTIPDLETEYSAKYNAEKAQTVTGYAIELSEGWEFVNADTALVIGTNKDIAVKFIPSDVANYTYEDYDADLGYVPGKVNVTLNKAEGTAPALPAYETEKRLASIQDIFKTSDFVTNKGVWSYTVEELNVGENNILFTYKPDNADKFDYSGLENWNAENGQFEFTATVKVLKPFLNVIVPPATPAHITYVEGGIKCGQFVLADGWEFFDPDATFSTAGEYESVRVRYPIPDGYDINPESGYIVEDGYIESTVSVFIDKAAFPVEKVSFLQTATYTGEKLAITEKVVFNELSDVTADDFTLSCDTDIIDAGEYVVYATVKETANYLGVTEKFQVGKFIVNRAAVTKDNFTVTNNVHVYDGTAKEATVTTVGGVQLDEVIYNDGNPCIAVGEYSIRVKGDAFGNFEAYDILLDEKLIIKKADGTAPAIPVYVAEKRLETAETVYKVSDFITEANGWTYDNKNLAVGTNEVIFTYKPADTDVYDYSKLENWNAKTEQFEYTVTLKVLKPFISVTAPANPSAKDWDETEKYTYSDFILSEYGWTYAAPETAITSAGSITNVKVLYAVSDAYDIPDSYTVEDGKIVSYVTITVNKANIPTNNITFTTQNAVYNGNEVVIDKNNLVITGLTGVTADAVTLSYAEGLTAIDANTYKVYATVAETANYKPLTVAIEIGEVVIAKADVAKDDITVANTEYTYDGSAKAPTATAKSGMGEPTVTVAGDAINAGKYNFTVSGEATTNYNAYTFTYENGLVINQAALAVDNFAIKANDFTYEGNAKKAEVEVKNAIGEIGAVTVIYKSGDVVVAEPTNAGEYDVYVVVANSTNYTALDETKVGSYTIKKATGTIPALTTVYEATYDSTKADKKVTTYITIADAAWTLTNADAVLEYKADNKYAVETVLDTVNYDYAAVEGVTVGEGKATSEITVNFKKATGAVSAPTAPATLTYDNTKADKKVATYIDSFGEGWTVADTEAVLVYGDNTITVKYTADTENYTWDGYVVGEGYITTTVAVKFNKAELPADAATTEGAEVEYDNNTHEIVVTANASYVGLGTFTVAYPEGNKDAGTYDVTATFAEGENYLGGTITFADVLVINKNVLTSISVPVLPTEAYIGDEFKGDAGESFKFAEDYVIVEGNNTIVITKTIEGSFAKNYDYTTAAEAAGVTVTTADNGDVTLTKTYTIVGKAKTGKISIVANTASSVEGASEVNDVIVTITPKGGESYILDSSKYTEVDNEIIISALELEAGEYTITIKKMKYLAAILSVTVEANGEANITIALTAGDIVGGEAGNETMGDGVIDIDDFVIAIRAFDPASSEAVKSAADINEDGFNNVTDLGFIKANFNKTVDNFKY